MTVVVDTNVVVSAALWPKSEDRRCFVLLARRKCHLAPLGNRGGISYGCHSGPTR